MCYVRTDSIIFLYYFIFICTIFITYYAICQCLQRFTYFGLISMSEPHRSRVGVHDALAQERPYTRNTLGIFCQIIIETCLFIK